MARVKRRTRDGGYLVGYRPLPGEAERYGVVADELDLESFRLEERRARAEGRRVPSPDDLFGRRTRLRSTTLRGWVGDPVGGTPGPFFLHATGIGTGQEWEYGHSLGKWVMPGVGDIPMAELTRRHLVERVVRPMLVCLACRRRAIKAGLDPKALELRVTHPAFDGRCVDDEGESTHYPAIRRRTMQKVLGLLHAAFEVGRHCDEPVCEHNPVTGYELPHFAQRVTNDEQSKALGHRQLWALYKALPEEVAALVPVGAYGLLRRSELLGLNRGDITWPGPNDAGVGHLDITRVYLLEGNELVLRPWGKTKLSTWPVMLARLATEALRQHLERFRSTPSPERCPACRRGEGEWREQSPNPHRRCDFADDAPVFVGAKGARLRPDVFADALEVAAERALLSSDVLGYRITPKILRATGGTLLLEIGVPPETVKRMGRWSNIETLLRHYHRTRDEARWQAARQLSDAADVELGREGGDHELDVEVRLRLLEQRAKAAEVEASILRQRLEALGQLSQAPAPPTSSRWNDADRLSSAVEGAGSRLEVLKRLGVAAAGKNYERLEAACREAGLVLPGRWDSLRKSSSVTGAVA